MDAPRGRSIPPLAPFKVGDRAECVDPVLHLTVQGTIRGFIGDRVSLETSIGWITVPVRALRAPKGPLG